MNISIGVVTSTNLKERYLACKNTWANDFKNIYFFGGNIYDENLISIKEASEDYNSHFLKQQLGLKFMYENNPKNDWYNMASCDNILYKNNMIEKLKNFNKDEDFFISQPCGIHEIEGIKFRAPAGGASFFISHSLIKKCYPIIDEFNDHWSKISNSNYPYSDMAISYMLKKYFNIDLTNLFYMFSQPPEHYNTSNAIQYYNDYSQNIEELIKTPISFHYIKPKDMKNIYEKYK